VDRPILGSEIIGTTASSEPGPPRSPDRRLPLRARIRFWPPAELTRALERALAGVVAVIDVTGPVKRGPKDLRGQVTRALLPVMQAHRVRRLVFLTGAGVRIEVDEPKVADRVIRGAMRLLQPAILADGQAAVTAVTGSGLDWTVVRVPRLTDAEPRGSVRVAAHVGGDTGTTLGRADLATFLLDEAEQGTWSGQPPVISW
jgi:putative NADH-flavin reductase